MLLKHISFPGPNYSNDEILKKPKPKQNLKKKNTKNNYNCVDPMLFTN